MFLLLEYCSAEVLKNIRNPYLEMDCNKTHLMKQKIYSPFRSLALIFCLFFSFAGIFSVNGQDVEEVYKINLNNVRLAPIVNGRAWIDSFQQSKASIPSQVVMQFYDFPAEATRTKLNAAGIHLYEYLGG